MHCLALERALFTPFENIIPEDVIAYDPMDYILVLFRYTPPQLACKQ